MSTLNKPFKHFSTFDLFNSSKVSTSAANTSYIQNGTVTVGTPDILWEHTVFIHDIAQIWNRGRFYNSHKYMHKMNGMYKNSFMEYSGMTVYTLIDKNPEKLYDKISVFSNYPGVLPAITIAPSNVTDINKIISIVDKGCDILSTSSDGISKYDSSDTKDNNYDAILEDMAVVQQWMTSHGFFTNCYKYPSAANASGESEFIQKYEEYGVYEASTPDNDITQDNMLLKGQLLSTEANVTSAISAISNNTYAGKWVIYILDTTNIGGTSLGNLCNAILTAVDNGDGIYVQMYEGLNMRASEFNIGRSEATLPFRVYKDGTVDATLTASSLSNITNGITTNTVTNGTGSDKALTSYGAYNAFADTEYVVSEAINDIKTTYLDPLGTAANKNYTTSVTAGSLDLVTSNATYNAINDGEAIVAETLAEFKESYLDTMFNVSNMNKILYHVAANLLSYWQGQGINVVLR